MLLRFFYWAALAACTALLAAAQDNPQSLLIQQLRTAGSESERLAMLDSAGALVNPDLLSQISAKAVAALSEPPDAEKVRLAEMEVAVARRIGTTQDVANAYLHLGQLLHRTEQFPAAIEAYQHALEGIIRSKDPVLAAGALNGIGRSKLELGAVEESIEQFGQAEELGRRSNDIVLLARILNNFGNALYRQGDFRRSAGKLEEALRLAEQRGERQGQAFVLNNLGNVFQHQGEYEVALQYYRKSLEIKRSLGNQRDTLTTLNNVALNEYYTLRYRESLTSFTNALLLARELGMKRMTATALNNRAIVEKQIGEYKRAMADLREANALMAPGGDNQFLANSFGEMAEAAYLLGRREEALDTARKALEVGRASGTRPALAAAANPAGRVLLRLGLLSEAETVLREGIAAVESMRTEVAGGETAPAGFLTAHGEMYDALSDVLAQQGRTEEALRIAERAKARALIDVMREGHDAFTRALTVEEKLKERHLHAALSQASANYVRTSNPRTSAARDNAERELAIYRKQLYTAHPDLQFRRAEFEAASADRLAALLPDRRTAMLEYVIDGETALLFLIRRSTSGTPVLTFRRLAANEDEIQKLAARLRDGIAGRGYEWREAARRLHDLLLAPVDGELKGVTAIVIAPEGPLWEIPFAALLDRTGKYLVERAALFLAPSLTALYESRLRGKSAAPSMIAFANPKSAGNTARLPEAEREANRIAAFYGARSKIYTGVQASENRLRSEAAHYSVVHLATHGTLSDSSPLYSYLTFTPDSGSGDDGLLETREMMDLNLNAAVVVLSACETARGVTSKGEGMIGMSWALLVAGASSAVVSHWRVDSAGTEEFMVAFHRRLAASAKLTGRAEALRGAALELMQKDAYKHPFYWAAFVLIGNGF